MFIRNHHSVKIFMQKCLSGKLCISQRNLLIDTVTRSSILINLNETCCIANRKKTSIPDQIYIGNCSNTRMRIKALKLLRIRIKFEYKEICIVLGDKILVIGCNITTISIHWSIDNLLNVVLAIHIFFEDK